MPLHADQSNLTSPSYLAGDYPYVVMVGNFSGTGNKVGKGAAWVEIQVNGSWFALPRTVRHSPDAYQLNLSPDQTYRVRIKNCQSVTVEVL